MKKLIIIGMSMLLATPFVYGQDNNNDHSDLFPKAGDYSLGIDMSNIIKFVGNSFSSNGRSNFPSNSMIEPAATSISVQPTVYGRYFLSDQTAARIRFGIGVNNSTNRQYVYDDVANIGNPLNGDPLTAEKTVDEFKRRNSRYELGIGLEKRKNLWRMQGYAGAELFAAYLYNKTYYSYGNEMTNTNQTPTTYDFFRNRVTNPTNRTMETTGGNTFHFGAGLYVGADYFITRNISMGAEFNLFFYGSRISEGSGIYETYQLGEVTQVESKSTPVNSGFNSRPIGTFNLSVYF